MHVGISLTVKGFGLQRCEDHLKHTNPFPHVYILYHFPHLFSHCNNSLPRSKSLQCKQNDMLKHGGQLLLLPQCVQVYCIAGLIHPGITGVWTDGGGMTGMMLKTALNTQQYTQDDLWKQGGQLLPLSQCFQYYWVAGLNHPGRMRMWTVRVIGHIWCWKRRKTPNNTNKRD